jgi:hypothetical protein
MCIVWMVVCRIGPDLLEEPSTFSTGRGCFKVRRVKAWRVAKAVLIIIPSALLSSRADALILRAEDFPMRETRKVMEGEHIFCMVPLGTGSESKVSKKVTCCTGSGSGNRRVLHDSAVVGPTRNPG